MCGGGCVGWGCGVGGGVGVFVVGGVTTVASITSAGAEPMSEQPSEEEYKPKTRATGK